MQVSHGLICLLRGNTEGMNLPMHIWMIHIGVLPLVDIQLIFPSYPCLLDLSKELWIVPVVCPELLHDHLGSGSIRKDNSKKVLQTRQHPRDAPHHQGIVCDGSVFEP